MFVFRLLRKIYRPFALLIFGCSSFFILTKISVTVSTTVRTAGVQGSLYMDDFESRILHSMVIEDDVKCDEMSVESGGQGVEEDVLPLPTAHQLPFCGGNAKKTKTQDRFETQEHDGVNNETGSDEFVLNEYGLKPGKQIVIATLDGGVSLLDNAGKILWSVCTGQLFSSTISTLQLSDRGKFIKLIPSLTGGLYKYDGESLQAMPLNADSLLQRSFKLAQDVVITGGKELRTFGVDIDSGLVKYECGISGCKSPTTAEFTSAEESSGIVLVIKKQLQTVRAIDSTTGIERWNFSVGSHELALAGVTDGCYEPADKDSHRENSDKSFRMIIQEGVVFGTDEESKALWKHKFDSPISQAWLLEDSHLQSLDPIKASVHLEDPPSLYVGMHRQQLYVQETHATAKRRLTAMELEDANQSDFTKDPLQIDWRPTSQHMTPAIADENERKENIDNKALTPLYSGPFFVYEREEIRGPLAIEAPPNAQMHLNDEDFEEVNEDGDSVDATVIMGLATLWFWWKEILGISLLTAVILNIILLRPVVHLTRKRTLREAVQQFNLFLRRNRNQLLALPAPPAPPALPGSSTSSDTHEPTTSSPNNNRIRTISNSSLHSTHSEEQCVVPFLSQYLKEFEPVQCLGRGAFGTVFEARKKIDDRSYAVKRIALPNREKSRDRVMREVKSLARLDHKNIVRYFNAWIESPPQGWLEKNDPLWTACHLSSPSPTYENYTSSEVFSKAFKNQSLMTSPRKDHSEIFVLDQTPDGGGEDSFIVFENEISRHDASESGIISDSPRKASKSDISEEFDEHDCDWLEEESEQKELHGTPRGELNLNSFGDCCETRSKFFHRPTTLDIPSSSDVTENKNSWDESLNQTRDGDPHSIMYLYIQQELCQKRTLQDWLRHEKTRNLKQVMGMFAQLVEAVEYIHSNKLIHRDLKPGNIFLAGGTGSDGDQMTVKIGDFGLATTLAGNEINAETPDGTRVVLDMEASPSTSVKLTGLVGTQLYMAPEQFEMKVYDHKVDIFSLGFIFFELLVPFSTDMEKHNELHNLRRLQFPFHFVKSHADQHELIEEMVSHSPNSRPDASEIKVYLSKYLHGTTIRSQSYPEHLALDTIQTRRKSNVRHMQDKDARHIYKTHSAM